MSDQPSSDLRVQLPTFEGPLDLLLYLVKQEEVDIYDIPIEKITKPYLEYLDLMQQLDLEIAGEFLVVAATLVYIKSRTLLPKTEQPPLLEEDEELEDPRWELIRQLVEYKKFKEAANHLETRLDYQEKIYHRGHFQWNEAWNVAKPNKGQVGVLELMDALNKIIAKIRSQPDGASLYLEKYTVADKMDFIRKLITFQDRTAFSELFAEVATRFEVGVTFLALLELLRQGELHAVQEGEFGEIMLARGVRNPETPEEVE